MSTVTHPDDLARIGRVETFRPKPNGRKIIGTTGADLDPMEFPPLKWVIPGILPEGLTVLAGRIKLGKSWLTQDWSTATAFGGFAMGSIACEQGDVLHLALEDSLPRLQRRQRSLLGDGPKPERVEYNTNWPRLDQGGLEEIDAWAASVPKPRLVIVDTHKMIRRPQRNGEQLYDYDYSSAEPLRDLANRLSLSVVLIHHLNKSQGRDDPFDLVSGSNGLSACADATLILDRNGQGTTLYGRGRDIEEFEKALSFDKTTGRWSVVGDAEEVHRSEERSAILFVLTKAGDPMGPKAIAAAANMKEGNVRFLLAQMMKAGQVKRQGYGLYTPTNTPNTPNTDVESEGDWE
jgi:hypothetical protein